MKFKTEDLNELAYDGEVEGYEVLVNDLLDTDRWTSRHKLIFSHEGKFYRAYYSKGLTEYQEQGPYEDEGDEIECEEVRPVQKIITVYERVG